MAFMRHLLLKQYLHQCDAKIAAFWRSVKEVFAAPSKPTS